MNKKILSLLITIIYLFTAHVSVLASSNSIYIKELGMSVNIPSNFSVITRNTPANDSAYDDVNITKDKATSLFNNNNMYLFASDENNKATIIVECTKNDFLDLNLYDDAYIETIAKEISSLIEQVYVSIQDYKIYTTKCAKFIFLRYKDDNNIYTQCYTINSHRSINILLSCLSSSSLSDSQNIIAKDIIDSVVFDSYETQRETKNYEAPFKYEDSKSGISFTIPENWTIEDAPQGNGPVDVVFRSNKDNSISIIFSATDVWSNMSQQEKSKTPRSKFDNSAFTKKDFAELLGIKENDIVSKEYGGIPFYLYTFEIEKDLNGHKAKSSVTQTFHIENGWLYLFQFFGVQNDTSLSDLESVINSIEFTTPESESTSYDSYSIKNFSEKLSAFISEYGEIIFFSVLLLVVIVAVFLHNRKRKSDLIQGLQKKHYSNDEDNEDQINACDISESELESSNAEDEKSIESLCNITKSTDDIVSEKKESNSYCNDNKCTTITDEMVDKEYSINHDSKKGFIFCRFCGEKVPVDSKYCTFCGNEIEIIK